MTDEGATTRVHVDAPATTAAPSPAPSPAPVRVTAQRPAARPAGASRKGVIVSALAVGAMLFAFRAQDLWQEAVGLPDLPGAELWALIFAATIGLGFVFPNPVASVAAGLAGFAAVIAALALTGDLADALPKGRGFDLSWLDMIAAPAGAHVIGVAARRVLSRPAEVAAA